jgi:hypothetical protein
MSSIEKALLMLRNLPRVAMHNIRDLPERQRVREKGVRNKAVQFSIIKYFN